jgi:hypothetical protein
MALIWWISDAAHLWPGIIDGDGWLTCKQQKMGYEVSIAIGPVVV